MIHFSAHGPMTSTLASVFAVAFSNCRPTVASVFAVGFSNCRPTGGGLALLGAFAPSGAFFGCGSIQPSSKKVLGLELLAKLSTFAAAFAACCGGGVGELSTFAAAFAKCGGGGVGGCFGPSGPKDHTSVI